MDNYSIDDLAREHGMDESDFSFYDDSGLGFVSQDFNPNITNCGKPSPSFYDEDIDEYENEQCMHLILVLNNVTNYEQTLSMAILSFLLAIETKFTKS